MSFATFELVRKEDETGVSGVGTVAAGIIWEDGSVAMRWNTATRSTAIYASLEDVAAIHGHGGKTVIVFNQDDEGTRHAVTCAAQDLWECHAPVALCEGSIDFGRHVTTVLERAIYRRIVSQEMKLELPEQTADP